MKAVQNIGKICRSAMYIVAAITLAVSATPFVFATPTFSNHSLPSSYTDPRSIVYAGESVWYFNGPGSMDGYIGGTSISGVSTDYDIRTMTGKSDFKFKSLVAGSDGNVWFNGCVGNSTYTGQLNISTGAVSLYSNALSGCTSMSQLVAGADGNLWFYIKATASNNYTYTVKVEPATGVRTIVHTNSDTYARYTSVTDGPDGNIWIIDQYYNRIKAIDASSGWVIASYVIPDASPTSYPSGLALGIDDNLWFRANGGKFYRLTVDGTFTEYTTIAPGMYPARSIIGLDGAMWFRSTNSSGAKVIKRVAASGSATEYIIPGSNVTTRAGLFLGPDDAMWFVYEDSGGMKLGRFGY